jgi:hypothetical protein
MASGRVTTAIMNGANGAITVTMGITMAITVTTAITSGATAAITRTATTVR